MVPVISSEAPAEATRVTGEFTTVFVHFASGQTQEWLLVRLPEPDDSTAASSAQPAVGTGKNPSS